MNTIRKSASHTVGNVPVAFSESTRIRGRKRALRLSTLALALALSAPAWASSVCELDNGQLGALDVQGRCVADTSIIVPFYEVGGGDDSGQASNVAIGQGAQAVSQRATAIGQNAYANSYSASGYNPGSTAVGAGTSANGWNATALGVDSTATGGRALAVGRLAGATGDNSAAIGSHASATHSGSVALGFESVTTANNTVSVGSDTLKRRIVNVAAGTLAATSTDAVNGSQLFATNTKVTNNTTAITNLGNQVTQIDGRVTNIEGDLNDGSIGLVRQDPGTGAITVASASGGTSVDFTGADGPRVLRGVANGVDDRDAATIAQLKASGLVDPNDGRALGAVVYDDMSLNRATLGGTNGTVIANLANGLVASGSREAVNGGQLAEIRDDLQNRIGSVSDRVNIIETGIADGSIGNGSVDDNGGQPIRNVGDGVVDSDAATVGQVNKRYNQAVTEANAYTDHRFDALQDDVNRRFEAVDGRIDRMAALSGAYAGMAMNTAGLAGRNRVGAGVGAQGGKTALAVGYQRILGSRNNASVSFGGAFSGSEKSVSAGAGFSW